jgi:hypothetical protein
MGISKGDKMTELRTYIVWGILALFLMVSIWGVLQLLQNTLFGGDASVSSPAGSYGGQEFSPFGP